MPNAPRNSAAKRNVATNFGNTQPGRWAYKIATTTTHVHNRKQPRQLPTAEKSGRWARRVNEQIWSGTCCNVATLQRSTNATADEKDSSAKDLPKRLSVRCRLPVDVAFGVCRRCAVYLCGLTLCVAIRAYVVAGFSLRLLTLRPCVCVWMFEACCCRI